jgi:dTDP-glucose pyrophosphorylase
MNSNYIPIVLLAGFGTRLRPLTHFIPKVICPIHDKPLAFYVIEFLFNQGFDEVHVNTHYKAWLVKEELEKARLRFGYQRKKITYWFEKDILETGGGIQRIYNELLKDDPSTEHKDLIITSGDILGDFPFQEMKEAWEHKERGGKAMMATKILDIARKDVTWVSKEGIIVGFGKDRDPEENFEPRLFTNYQILSKEVLQYQKEVRKISSIDLFYRAILKREKKILNFDYSSTYRWFNIGEVETYLQALEGEPLKELAPTYVLTASKELLLLKEPLKVNVFHSLFEGLLETLPSFEPLLKAKAKESHSFEPKNHVFLFIPLKNRPAFLPKEPMAFEASLFLKEPLASEALPFYDPSQSCYFVL